MNILIIYPEDGIRESVNLNTLQIELGKLDITVGDLLNYLKREYPILQQISTNRELNLYYIRDGRPIFLKKGDKLRMYSGYETLYLSQELNYGTIEDRLPIRRTEEAPVETPVEMSEEAFSRFRWGFTTATGLLVFLWIAFSTWNRTVGSLLFFIIFCYIPAILYVYLVDNNLKYYRLYPIEYNDQIYYYITDIFAVSLIIGGSFSILFPKFSPVLLWIVTVIILWLIRNYYRKTSESIRFILMIGGSLALFNSVLIHIFPDIVIFLFLPILSYFLSKKIFEINILKRYDLFNNIFKDWFYKLRIAILIFIIYYFMIGFSSFELDSTNLELDSTNLKTTTNSIGMQFVLIPAGEFKMGSPSGEGGRIDNEGPVHTVTIEKAYYLSKYEVTQKQWMEVMGSNPSYFKFWGDDLPVDQISWNDVQEFIRKLNAKEGTDKYRLPSEAEWEYAARAGTTTQYSFGDSGSKLGEYAWSGVCSHPRPVGQKKPNTWGLYDMHGNVWEWVQDWYHSDYDGAPTDGSAWESGGGRFRVIRGGGWEFFAGGCRSASRADDSPGARKNYLGFRLVQEV